MWWVGGELTGPFAAAIVSDGPSAASVGHVPGRFFFGLRAIGFLDNGLALGHYDCVIAGLELRC